MKTNVWTKFIGRMRANQREDRLKRPYKQRSDPEVWISQPLDLFLTSFTRAIITMFATALLIMLGSWILSGPDVMAATIAGMMAETCQATGECRFSVLLPAFGAANIILLHLLVYFVWLTGELMRDDKREETVSEGELRAALQGLYDGLNDVQYKIIQLARGEPIESGLTEPQIPAEAPGKKSPAWLSMILVGVVVVIGVTWLAVIGVFGHG